MSTCLKVTAVMVVMLFILSLCATKPTGNESSAHYRQRWSMGRKKSCLDEGTCCHNSRSIYTIVSRTNCREFIRKEKVLYKGHRTKTQRYLCPHGLVFSLDTCSCDFAWWTPCEQ